MKNPIKLALSIFVSLAAGAIGSIFTASNIPTWYQTLTKPSFTPPNWLFGPVWTTLYILMGVALYLIWINKSKDKGMAYPFFIGQLILNAFWSIIFFGQHDLIGGFSTIVLLWIFILASILSFYRVNKVASFLLIPYILWVSFASALNYAIMMLNK